MSVVEARERRRKATIGVAVLGLVALPFVYSAIVVPLSPWEQAEVSLALLGFAMLASLQRRMRPLIIFLSCFASMRYLYWRVGSTLSLDSVADSTVSLLLLGAEIYGLLILFLGYFQTIEVEPRAPAPVGAPPSVDVFIPTYNEPLDIVRRTVIGALAIDYARKKVFVLDDGRRPEFEQMARELGCFYLTRPDNLHAKAGNLNHALARTHGELIAVFDADHVPVRGFLRKTVGFFQDGRVAFVQTAQHFFNPDPYERNLKLTGRIAPEQAFFYHVIQPGNDFWNAAFFCGSSAVLRRSALAAIGGFRTVTVTEDAHTALELHAQGWSSVYLALPLAAGLATESFAAHVQQRMRWARGMAQILRLDLPLLKPGLTLAQRLNYFNAMMHFFFGFPRLVMVLAPLCYLLFGVHPMRADVPAVLAYILPHIGLSTIANSLISEVFRHSFWAGVYEVSIAPYTAAVTFLALINPRLGRFNVTEKGTNLERARFDFHTSRGTLLLLGLSGLALAVAFPLRLALSDVMGAPPAELHALLINAAWALANLVVLVAAACVAYEQPQQRRSPRIQRDFGCEVRAGGKVRGARTLDLSERGARLAFPEPCAPPEECELAISGEGGAARLRGALRWSDWGPTGGVEAGFEFPGLDAAEHRRLTELIFTGDASWLKRTHPRDDPLRSFGYLLATVLRVTRPRWPSRRHAPRLPGRWPCTVDGREGVCLSASPLGALVEVAAPFQASEPAVTLTFDEPPSLSVGLRGRILRREGSRVALAFQWESSGAREAFAGALYASRPQPPRVRSSRSFWRRAEAMRT